MDEDVKHKVDFDDKGNVVLKEKKKVAMGAKSRAGGAQFELRVRRDLNEKGWIVDKWTNNIDLEKNELIAAKRKMRFINQNMRFMALGTGFPDFIAFQLMDGEANYRIVGVEVKMNGKLSRMEKEKCRWYLERKIFNEIWIASKIKEKNRVRVVYDKFG
jgi:hypothetical protein